MISQLNQPDLLRAQKRPLNSIVRLFAMGRDRLTIVALAVIAYALASVVHEGLGHGGACVLSGGKPQLITSMQFQGDSRGLSTAAVKFIAAGGTIANLILAVVAIALLARRADATWFFLWLTASINLMVATGYLLYSGVANIGDWSVIIRGWSGGWFWRITLTLIGGATYWLTVKWAMRTLGSRLGEDRVRKANSLSLVSFITGGVLSVVAGVFDPGGLILVLISGTTASLGGTSGLAWGPQLLHDPAFAPQCGEALEVRRSWRAIAAAVAVAAMFILLLGPGVKLSR